MSTKAWFGLIFHVRETNKNVEAFRRFDEETCGLIEKDIRLTYKLIDESQDLEETLKEMMVFAKDRREVAPLHGRQEPRIERIPPVRSTPPP